MWHDEVECLHHVVCGRGLPGAPDKTLEGTDVFKPIASWLDFVNAEPPGPPGVCAELIVGLEAGLEMQRVAGGPAVQETAVATSFTQRTPLVLFVLEHNVGLRFQPSQPGTTAITAFRLQLTAKATMSTAKPVASFPTTKVEVEDRWLGTRAFATNVSVLSRFAPPDCLPRSWKDGAIVAESREVTDPRYFTEWLLPTLAAASAGTPPAQQQSPGVRKTAHDTVSWADADVPWRRSATYTGLKAMIHVHLVETLGPEQGRMHYKAHRLLYLLYIWRKLEPQLLSHHSGHATAFLVKMDRRLAKLEHDVAGADHADEQALRLAEIRQRLLQAHAAVDVAWKREATKPAPIEAPSSTVLDEPVAQLVGQPALASAVHQHNARLQQAVDVLASAQGTATYEPSHSETAETGPDGAEYALLLRAELHFDWVLGGCADDDEKSPEGWFDELVSLEEQVLDVRSDPIMHSRRVLVGLALFLRIDKAVGRRHDLITSFSTGVNPDVIAKLVLPSIRWRRVALALEQALRRRCGDPLRTLHGSEGDAFPFQKQALQNRVYRAEATKFREAALKAETEGIAAKKKEVLALREERREAVAKIAELGGRHHFSCNQGGNYMGCDLCRLRRSLYQLTTKPFCKLLPADAGERDIISFEMTQSVELLKWREAAAHVTAVVLRFGNRSPEDDQELFDWPAAFSGYGTYDLREWTEKFKGVSDHVKLCSTTKWTSMSHYGKADIDCAREMDEFILSNGGNVRFFNPTNKTSPGDGLYTFTLTDTSPHAALKRCMHLPADGSCNQNLALAKQHECPDQLALNEFVTFGSVRSGCTVQHHSLLSAVASDSLTFSHPDVLLLVQQTLWQAEQGNGHWWRLAGSASFTDAGFIDVTLDACTRLANSSRDQWEKPWVVAAAVLIAARCLFPGTCSAELATTNGKAMVLLENTRGTAGRWLHEQSARLREDMTTGKLSLEESEERKSMLLSIALVGLMTYLPAVESNEAFDGVDGTAGHALLRSVEATDQLLKFASAFDKGSAAPAGHLDPLVSLSKHVLLALQPHLHRQLGETAAEGLSLFASGSTTLITRDGDHVWDRRCDDSIWFFTRVNDGQGGPETVVEVNSLTGGVLVNGDSVECLPEEIRTDSAFQELFSKRALVVLNSGHRCWHTLPTKGAATFHFTLGCKNEVVIEMTPSGSADRWRLLPSVNVNGTFNKLPMHLYKLYSHWFCDDRVCFLPKLFSSDTVEDFSDPILRSRYLLQKKGGVYVLADQRRSGSTSLLASPSHSLTKFCCRALLGADDADFTHVWWSRDGELSELTGAVRTGEIAAKAVRVQLSFKVTAASGDLRLESDFNPGFVVAQNQNFGALLGLSSGLLLENSGALQRQFIMPVWLCGHTRKATAGGELSVDLIRDRRAKSLVKTYRYLLNAPLRQLIGPADTTAFLYLAYLHAITSGFQLQPDPWTGRTGVEAATDLLQSPRVVHHEPYSEESHSVLDQLTNLSPNRKWYPAHLKVMETVKWPTNRLPAELALDVFAVRANELRMLNAELRDLFPRQPTGGSSVGSDEHTTDVVVRAAKLHSRFLNRSSAIPGCIYDDPDDAECAEDDDGGAAGAEPEQDAEDGVVGDADALPAPWLEVATAFGTQGEESARFRLEEEKLVSDLFDDSGLQGRDAEALFCAGWLGREDTEFKEAQCSVDFLTLAHQASTADKWESNLLLVSAIAWHGVSVESAAFGVLFGLSRVQQQFMCEAAVGGDRDREYCRETQQHYADLVVSGPDHLKDFPVVRPTAPNCYTSVKEADLAAFELQKEAYEEKQATEVAELRSQFARALATTIEAEDLADPLRGCADASEGFTVATASECVHVSKLLSVSRAQIQMAQTAHQVVRFVLNIVRVLHGKTEATEWSQLTGGWTSPLPTGVTLERLRCYRKCLRATWHQSDVAWRTPVALPSPPWNCNSAALPTTKFDETLHIDGADELTAKLNQRTKSSFEALGSAQEHANVTFTIVEARAAREYLEVLSGAADAMWEDMLRSFVVQRPGHRLEHVCPNVVIQALSTPRARPTIILTVDGRNRMVELMRLWTLQQKTVRILHHVDNENTMWRDRELLNPPHRGWNPVNQEHLPWLCFELESDLSIWERQCTVCNQMIGESSATESATNSDSGNPDGDAKHRLVQLNMGEGKTSVILPMLSVVLGDGDNLCRVIVPSALLRGNADSLALALGGLLRRNVWIVPCHRGLPFSQEMLDALLARYQRCREEGAIVITTPESVLSFHLKLTELGYKDEDSGVAQAAARIQRFVLQYGREVLDEADSILHFKRQLVYTMGDQVPADGGALRWTVAQETMLAVFSLASEAKERFDTDANDGQQTIELQPFGGPAGDDHSKLRVPRLLEASTRADEAWRWIRNKVLKMLLGDEAGLGMDLPQLKRKQRKIVEDFVLAEALEAPKIAAFEGLDISDTAKCSLKILRGLLSYDVLRIALTKRWRVNFGVDRTCNRRRMAVPFEAKDCAKPNTEFGHVDVAVVLTIISYSRCGLLDSEMTSVFEMLQVRPEPEKQYQSMVCDTERTYPVDARYGLYKKISLSDESQRTGLFDALRVRHGVIKFFLESAVFPREVKHFPDKLVATPWDLVLQCKTRPLCGFSGTNDTEFLLPPTVAQHDLDALLGTNARVLVAVMEKRNNVVKELHPHDPSAAILEILASKAPCGSPVNVLLDVGALLLADDELFAKKWLDKRKDCHGVIMYRSDRLEVMLSDGTAVPLALSPLAGNLGSCLVLLDEAHCRGTDLRLPKGSVAALTLGRGLTRDKFVQAAMRMRALISGDHSLIFLAAAEVHAALKTISRGGDRAGEGADDTSKQHRGVTNKTVVQWTLGNMRMALLEGVGHWVNQGVFSTATDQAMTRMIGAHTDHDRPEVPSVKAFGTSLCHRDAVNVHSSYGVPRRQMRIGEICTKALAHVHVDGQHPWVTTMHDKCGGLFGAAAPRFRNDDYNSLVDEEQERELEVEEEEERQIERPQSTCPADAVVDPLLLSSVKHGEVDRGLCKLNTLFTSSIALDPAANCKEILGRLWSKNLRYTQGFCTTVKTVGGAMDDFLRPVLFVVEFDSQCVLVSPREAEEVLKLRPAATRINTRGTPRISLRLISPRTQPDAVELWSPKLAIALSQSANCAARALKEQQDALLNVQLHLFAGSTQFSLSQQMLLCATLGICCAPHTAEEEAHGDGISSNGFVDPLNRKFTEAWLLADGVQIDQSASSALRSFLSGPRHLGTWLMRTPLGSLLGTPATHFFDQGDPPELERTGTEGGDEGASADARKRLIWGLRLLTVGGPGETSQALNGPARGVLKLS